MKTILVIDGQGGGVGKAIIEKISKAGLQNVRLVAMGTNALATSNMLKAGADVGATGENAIVTSCAKADIIVGPMGIVLADSMWGEISANIANTVARSTAQRVLIPIIKCSTFVAGVEEKPLGQYIDSAIDIIKTLLK